ncbi:hypothetical protein [Arthrobacter sulfonylureivorans]|uniref:hypothetical protein n=1 Tax=Arthrobacter sulfonylureivorans TaxID=2486855 RepID=UPI0030D11263
MDRDALAKLAARYTRRAEPVSLTPEELDLEHCKVTRVVPGVPVWAWIRFPGAAGGRRGVRLDDPGGAGHLDGRRGPPGDLGVGVRGAAAERSGTEHGFGREDGAGQ